jgi:GNAT superfamily N-acetyltransferase
MNHPPVQTVNYGTHEYQAVWNLREAVLRQPLGLSLADEDLRGEAAEIIVAMLDGEHAVACIHLKPVDAHTGKLRQMAVAPELQGKGLGRILMDGVEKTALNRGITHLELHARETAVPFYEKLGYTIVGDRFEEVSIPHFKMEKHLTT